MPDIECYKCGTILLLPYRRTTEHPSIKRICPTCGIMYMNNQTEPTMLNKPGAIQQLQEELSKTGEPEKAVAIKGPWQDWKENPGKIPDTGFPGDPRSRHTPTKTNPTPKPRTSYMVKKTYSDIKEEQTNTTTRHY